MRSRAESVRPAPREVLAATGLTLEQVARRARIGVPYLRQLLREGGAPYSTALRLAGVLRCRPDLFLFPPPGGRTPHARGTRGRRTSGSRSGAAGAAGARRPR